MCPSLAIRTALIGFGILFVIASPLIRRWEKKHIQEYSVGQQVKTLMFPGWAACIIIGTVLILAGTLS
jgi:hypothetical protein